MSTSPPLATSYVIRRRASSFVYHRIISLTQSVGAMLWSMAQLRRGHLRMVVYVVGSCWWCGQLSVLARHTHMPHCPPVPTSSSMLCTDRPQFAVCLGSSSVFDSVLLPWRLLQGPVRGGVLGWVRMLPTPASTLPQSMHPSAGPQGWHLASPEPPCCRVYGTWVCMGALRSLSYRAGCASRVSLLSVPRRGWLLSALGQQGLSLLRQGAETQESAWDNHIWRAVDCDVNLLQEGCNFITFPRTNRLMFRLRSTCILDFRSSVGQRLWSSAIDSDSACKLSSFTFMRLSFTSLSAQCPVYIWIQFVVSAVKGFISMAAVTLKTISESLATRVAPTRSVDWECGTATLIWRAHHWMLLFDDNMKPLRNFVNTHG